MQVAVGGRSSETGMRAGPAPDDVPSRSYMNPSGRREECAPVAGRLGHARRLPTCSRKNPAIKTTPALRGGRATGRDGSTRGIERREARRSRKASYALAMLGGRMIERGMTKLSMTSLPQGPHLAPGVRRDRTTPAGGRVQTLPEIQEKRISMLHAPPLPTPSTSTQGILLEARSSISTAGAQIQALAQLADRVATR